MAFFSAALGFFLAIAFIASYIYGDGFDSSLINSILTWAGLAIWTPIFHLFFAYLMTDIRVDNDGMNIQFLWKTIQIKWDDIVEIKPLKAFGLFTNKRSSVVIVKARLTFIHRIYGVFYGGKNQPAILITRTISDYDLLVKTISAQARKNQRNMSKNKSITPISS
jgi:hypothetical protein